MSFFSIILSSSIGSEKLGHPQPALNLCFELNRGSPETISTYIPSSLLSLYSLEKGLSVASFCVTLYCIDVSFSFKVLSSGLKYFLLIFILLSNLFFYSVQIAWF